MKQKLKTLTKKSFGLLGLKVHRKNNVQRKNFHIYDDYLDALHEGNFNEPALFYCDIKKIVNPFGFRFDNEHWHPFVALLINYSKGIDLQYQESILERFYSKRQPSNAKERLLGNETGPHQLTKYPPYLKLNPWHPGNVKDISRKLIAVIERENERAGYPDMTISEGINLIGPVSNRKGKMEYDRLVNVYNSIKINGYDRNRSGFHDIKGTILKSDNDFSFFLNAGRHRTAALAALGYEKIPVRINLPILIQTEFVNSWPQVKNGIWPINDALKYFNMLFTVNRKNWANDHRLLNY